MFPPDIEVLAREVVERAAVAGLMVTTAESCTGGLVAGALTAIPGSSVVVERGFITYSNTAKVEMLDVALTVIEQHGAVSERVARAMIEGALRQSDADLGVSVTGIAGPGGGSDEKPVGLVHFASAGPLGLRHEEHRFGDIGRDAVRSQAVRTALRMLLEQMA